ncbi:uncharacterized protein SPAPADRAFT_57073 [Spathaspora passalidarum NRRL Y-27907]|uniref:Uncharacterized protein n=1 Tax=Spathaspora passalidarum (strain NRRL Y-27907 / 11-Y1) TaxID=619300 RepID=G3AT16_SPAPN|nr:uncharacterized protein SPAPADRAFT_57073 [Spathaspora passalidarum NRRL Y-27907]EGW31176.1 hypothetical protein SPAPADRAFT_57073 [Spathaspora passalidarum NRRL Y-27907]
MSFKGIKKTIIRAPQTFRQKMNMGEMTTDAVYQDAERRFKELEIETKKLTEESQRYFTAVNGMLDYEIDFSKAFEEIYKPISGRVSDPTYTVPEDNPEGIKAAEQFREVVKELKETLKPDLELIEKRILHPAQELLKVIQSIRKMATKREHKQLDLDRHKRTHKKYEEKKERTAKDEEKMYNAEAEVQIAQQEYDYYNDMLKTELPILFQMQSDFLRPLFISLYYMQLNIFYTLYNRMEELKIPYFDLTTDIVEAYNFKKGNVEEQTDAIPITHFKVGHAKAKLEATKRRYASMNSPPGGSPVAGQGELPPYSPGQYAQPQQAYGDYKSPEGPGYQPQQAYPQQSPTYGGYGQQSPVSTGTTGSSYGQQSPYGAPASAPGAVPAYGAPAQVPPTPTSATQTCTALYDYTAQAQGDLTFPAGAVIEIQERTADTNGWWTGRYNGHTGTFPGNYVQLN